MRPGLGRIVHFKAPGEGDVYPAIVTQVHEDGLLDLCAFGSKGLSFETRVIELTADRRLEVGGWFWPEREAKP